MAKKVGKAIGADKIIEVAASSLTAFGAMTGISTTLNKQLKEAGVIDSFKDSIKQFGQTVGVASKYLPQTDKDKQKGEEAEQDKENERLGDITSYSLAIKKQFEEIQSMIQRIDQEVDAETADDK